MKLSNFNLETKKGDNTIVYNSLSSGVLMLNEEYTKKFNDIKNNRLDGNEDLVNELTKGKMLIQDDIDELKLIKLFNLMQRFDTRGLSLTIAPTSFCNFVCPYCYEEGIDHFSMNDEVKEDLIKFIESFGVKNLSICWYGGEPLLELNSIQSITKEILQRIPDINLNASIVTNGYLLDKSAAEILKECNVSHVQITLDGTKEFHDSRRKLRNGNGSFERIIENLKEVNEILDISVRVNVDKTNIGDISELIEFLKAENLWEKVGFYMAPVEDINSSCKNTNCFTDQEFSKNEYSIFKKWTNYNPKSRLPIANLGICGAVSLNSYVVDPEGNLFKCWDEIGRMEYSVGSLKKGVVFNSRLINWLTYDGIESSEKCKECTHSPSCYGGCPYVSVQGEEKKCIPFKFNGDDVINSLQKAK